MLANLLKKNLCTGQGLNGENDIDLFVHRIAAVVERFDLDGVDLGKENSRIYNITMSQAINCFRTIL